MKAVKFVDVPVSENRDIQFEVRERIIGVSITNQGTVAIGVAMGGQNALKVIDAGADVSYGDVNGGADVFYLTGNLKIESTDWANSSVVLTYAYDVTEQIDQQDC